MRKVYLPVYIIEWSDIRPYAIQIGQGIVFVAVMSWKGLCIIVRALYRLITAILLAIWHGLLSVFTMTNPHAEDEEFEEEEEEEHNSQNESRTPPVRRSMFDED